MIMCIDFGVNQYCELEGRMIRYWNGRDLQFQGTLDEFLDFYPDEFAELQNLGAVKQI